MGPFSRDYGIMLEL